MNISEMHTYFRQYAQQMGMQNVRAILPEQIDILLNTSISDTVNQIIRENIGVTSDRVITDNSKIGSINFLRTLYRVHEESFENIFLSGDNNGHMVHLKTNDTELENINFIDSNKDPRYLFIVDFAINYKRTEANFITNYFPVRIIDDIYLADVLNDFILCPRFRSPIITVTNMRSTNSAELSKSNIIQLDLYIDKGEITGDTVKAKLYNGLIPNQFRISYLGKPNTVVFNEDNEGTSVNCDLPEYTHVDIVKHAVDLYHTALQGSLYAAQQAEQQQQRENVRNNARNDN